MSQKDTETKKVVPEKSVKLVVMMQNRRQGGRGRGLSIYKWKHEKTTLFGATKNSAANGSGVLSGLALLSPSRRVESMGRELAAWEASRSWEGGRLGNMEWVGQEEEQSGNYFLHCLTKNGQGR